MKSVADDLRREQRERILRLTPEERVALLEKAREEGLTLFMAGQRVDRREAIRRIRLSRKAGRRRSRAMDE